MARVKLSQRKAAAHVVFFMFRAYNATLHSAWELVDDLGKGLTPKEMKLINEIKTRTFQDAEELRKLGHRIKESIREAQ